jgi:hypothetical protein
MALSFDSTNWTGWMPFENNKQIDLAGHLDATKLYVTYGDRAGGQSPVYSADIPAASQAAVQQTTQTQATTQSTQAQQATQTQQGVQTATQGQAGASRVEETAKAPLDLSITDMRLPQQIIAGQNCNIEVIVKNDSEEEIRDCQVNFESEDGFKDRQRISLRPRGQERVRFSWTPASEGRQKITSALEYKDDANARNNILTQAVQVIPAQKQAAEESILTEKRRPDKGLIKEKEKEEIIDISR